MEKVPGFFYLMYYFLVREDGVTSKKGRVLFILETALGMFLAIFVFALIGVFNIRNLYIFVPVAAITPFFFSWLIITRYYKKSGRDLEIIESSNFYSKKQRRLMAMLALVTHIVCFGLMFCGGVLMSYLWSLHH